MILQLQNTMIQNQIKKIPQILISKDIKNSRNIAHGGKIDQQTFLYKLHSFSIFKNKNNYNFQNQQVTYMKVANQFEYSQSQKGKKGHNGKQQKELISNTNKFNFFNGKSFDFQEEKQNSVGSLENGEITQFYFQKLIHIQIQLCLVVVLNMFLVITSSSINFPQVLESNMATYQGALYFSMICFIVECLLLGFRMITVMQLEKQQKILYQKSTIFSSKKIFYFFAECFVMLIQPYPFFDNIFIKTSDSYKRFEFDLPINDLLTALSVLRIYVLIRAGLILTPYRNTRSNRLCKMYGCKADFSFSLKCMFKDNPMILIGIFFTVSALIFAFQINLVERRASYLAQNSLSVSSNYMNSLWLILMTITTVGYGDYFPHTAIGRIIILIVAVWGTFIVSMMVVVVSNTLTMEKNQKRTSIVINKLQLRGEIQKQAKNFLGYFMLLKKYQKLLDQSQIEDKSSKSEQQIQKIKERNDQYCKKIRYYKHQFNKSKKKFSKLRKQIKNGEDIQDIQDQVSSHFLHINSDVEILNRNQQKIINFIHQYLEYNGDSKQQVKNQKNQQY